MLFHVSEQSGIKRFEPRSSEYASSPVVWAIDAERLRNYLLPRDCPRVTYYAESKTTEADREKFLGSSAAVVAIESAWYERLRLSKLYCYHLVPDTFECIDDCAGYHVSGTPVVPIRVETIEDPISELLRRGVEIRILKSLWALRDAVVSSSLQFSIIRMRNAQPRLESEQAVAADHVENCCSG